MGLGDKLVKTLKKAVIATGEFVDAHQEDLKKAGDTLEAKSKEAWQKTREVGGQALEGAKKAFETAKQEIDEALKSDAPEAPKSEDETAAPKSDASDKGPENPRP